MDARRSRYLRSGGVISYARSGSRSLRCLDSRNRCKVRAPPSLGRDNSPIRCRVRRLATRVLVASFPATLFRDEPVAVAKVDRDLDDRASARIAPRARSDGRCSEQPPGFEEFGNYSRNFLYRAGHPYRRNLDERASLSEVTYRRSKLSSGFSARFFIAIHGTAEEVGCRDSRQRSALVCSATPTAILPFLRFYVYVRDRNVERSTGRPAS